MAKILKGSARNRFPRAVQKEAHFEVQDAFLLQGLLGEAVCNLHTIEELLDVRIGRVPEGLLVRGLDNDVDLTINVLEQLRGLVSQGETLWPGDVERAVQMLSSNCKAKLADLFREQIRIAGRTYSVVPKTFNQKQYIQSIREHDLVFGIGPAGTGKTYLAMAMAISALLKHEVKRVVLCRPAVEAGEKLGFLPGDMAEKVNPYLRPLYDALHHMVDFDRAKELVEKGAVEVAPLAFMRGRTLSEAFVILDEAQNTTSGQMKMLLTRIGTGSKCVVTGDVTQIDLPKGVTSGLHQAQRVLREVQGIDFVYFNEFDVIRHPLVAAIVAAYEQDEQ